MSRKSCIMFLLLYAIAAITIGCDGGHKPDDDDDDAGDTDIYNGDCPSCEDDHIVCVAADWCLAAGGVVDDTYDCEYGHCCEIVDADCVALADWCLAKVPGTGAAIDCWCGGTICFDEILDIVGSCSGPHLCE